jgi:hypothetical protein
MRRLRDWLVNFLVRERVLPVGLDQPDPTVDEFDLELRYLLRNDRWSTELTDRINDLLPAPFAVVQVTVTGEATPQVHVSAEDVYLPEHPQLRQVTLAAINELVSHVIVDYVKTAEPNATLDVTVQ